MSSRLRKIIPFLAAVVLGLCVAAIANAAEWGPGASYGLIGFVAGILLLAGLSFAFGGPLKDHRGMHPNEAAVGADHDESRDAASDDDGVFFAEGLQEDDILACYPAVVLAGDTVTVYAALSEGFTEVMELGHAALQ